MIKQKQLGYKGMNQDLAKSKQDGSHYFRADNIRILSTDSQSTFAVTNEHGNELVFTIPTPVLNLTDTSIDYTNLDPNGTGVKSLNYIRTGNTAPGCEIEDNYAPTGVATTSGDQVIIGTTDTRNGAVIITTDDNGWDCIWELNGMNNGVFTLDLRYMNNIGLSSDDLIQILYNYENSIIEKAYFVDGKHQIRFVNLRQSQANGDLLNLADVKASSINSVSEFNLSQPVINNVTGGGGHVAGKIQYAYNLYVLNGSQTTISPLTELQPLDNGVGLGGGAVNEGVGRTVVVGVNDLDNNFTHIKLYAIKYTSYNQVPQISLIADREIDNFDSFSYYDDGSTITDLSLEQFLFLGSNPIVPKHIESKDSRLFMMNVKEQNFEVDIDARIYGHNTAGMARIWENVQLVGNDLVGDTLTINTGTYAVPEKHDAVNRNYNQYNRTQNATEFGAEGLYFKLVIDQSPMVESEAINNQFLKDREIYRFAIEFFNDLGQKSSPQWLCDLRAPEGNLDGNYNKVRFELKPAFIAWLAATTFGENEKPVGYRLLRADRTLADRTILTQGMINPMVVNYKHDRKEGAGQHQFKNNANKMPSMVRLFEDSLPMIRCNNANELSDDGSGNWTYSRTSETITSCSSDDFRAQTWQFNRLMQMFTPDLLFDNIEVDSSYQLNVIGLQEQDTVASWLADHNPFTKQIETEAKFNDGITAGSPGVEIEQINGDPLFLADRSFFGPANNDNTITYHQVYRGFNTLHRTTGQKLFNIYGTPEITERGADFKAYNNDFSLRYSNNLLGLLQDDWRRCSDVNDDSEQQVFGSNSFGAKCITFAEGPDSVSYPIGNRKSIETIFAATGIAQTKGVLITELVKNNNALYLGNIYGGNSFEAKSVSNYIEIGSYNDVTVTSTTINSPGDTYVQDFVFEKLSKTDTDPGDRRLNQTTEIIKIRTETTIDLKNRNDISINAWDNRFQPRYDEFQQYNNVYSQQPTLVQVTDPGFKFKKVQEYDTRVITTKVKIPGENIDSWTDVLENETLDLDGKYGPINATINSNDEIFVLQDTGVAHLSINPRVQATGSDGLSVELGTGGILHDYDYLSTKSGCLNKRSVISTDGGFYYFDLINKGIMVVNGGGVKGLSDFEGFHHFFNNNTSYDKLIIDNAVKDNGISVGYNPSNNDVYFTFLQKAVNTGPAREPDVNFTICYNEAAQSFTSFYDYTPAWYINKGANMVTTDKDSKGLWQHFKGERGNYYGTKFNSSVVFNVSPQGDGEFTFNNLSYKSEMKDKSNKDIRDTGLSSVEIWNEYQKSNITPIVLRKNTKRRNRNWSITLPRERNSKNRIKSPWAFLKVRLDNVNDYKMTLHDLIVSYTEY